MCPVFTVFHHNPCGVRGRWKVPPSQLALCDLVGGGCFVASGLTIGVLTPIQEDQETPGEAGDTAVYLRVLLAVGSSRFGIAGLPGVTISFPFAWFVIQSALFNNNLIPSLLLPFTFHA